MITRQRALLRLVEKEGGEVSKLRLVKLAFLLSQGRSESASPSVYDFLPYHYGPYSFTLTHELRSLERDGWIRVHDVNIVASRDLSSEVSKLDRSFCREIDELSNEMSSLSTPELVREVYRAHPWYTANAKDARKRQVALPNAELAVYTVGYEGLMLDGLLNLLLRSGIRRLIDVRCNPVARRFGFHRSTMERHCRDVHIDYVHIPHLGIPSELRTDLTSLEDYNRIFKIYEESILRANEDWIRMAEGLISETPSALMCMEEDARCCHRTRLAGVISRNTRLPHRELRAQ